MTATHHYQRMAIPREARVPVALVIPLWFAIVFSPFVAFWVNGKVDDSDWTPAIVTAVVALSAIMALNLRAAANYRALPASLRDQYAHGKLLGPLSRAALRKPRDFACGAAGGSLHAGADGVSFTAAAWIGSDSAHRSQRVRLLWKLMREGRYTIDPEFIPWREIAAWEVHDDSESADYYRLTLTGGGYRKLRRPASARDEIDLLDTVRSVGQVGMRLFCDITPEKR